VLQDRFNYQDVLRESVKAVVTILEFSELLDYLVGTIQRSLRSSSVCLYLKDEHEQFPLSHGYSGMIDILRDRPLDSGVVELVRQAGQSVVREELERILPAASFGPLSGYMKDIGAELVIPLRYKGLLQGVLTVGYKGDGEHYSQSDIDLLDALAGHAAVAIENARLYEEARRVQESLRESEARFTTMIERTIQRYLAPERQEP
jgi:sigma-B regulation protein RsbU (phosphoserine phosphatase)